MPAPFLLVLNGACLLSRSRSGVLVGGSTQAGGVSTSPSLISVMKSLLAGSWWALVNPFSWQPAHRAFPRISPAPSLPPTARMLGSRCQPGNSGCSTLYLTVNRSLLSSVPHPGSFLTSLLSLWNVFLQEDRLIFPTPFLVSPTVTFM